MQRTILASSTGWNAKEPRWTQSRAPLMFSPKWGTRGSSSSTDRRRRGGGSGSGRGRVTGGRRARVSDVGGHPDRRPGGLQRHVVSDRCRGRCAAIIT